MVEKSVLQIYNNKKSYFWWNDVKDDKNTYKKIIIAEIRATINIKMCTEE